MAKRATRNVQSSGARLANLKTGKAARAVGYTSQWLRRCADRGLITCERTAHGRLFSAEAVQKLAARRALKILRRELREARRGGGGVVNGNDGGSS